MKRAIRRFVSSLTGKKKYIFFISLLLICISVACIGIYAQFYYKYAETDPLMFGNVGSEKKAEEIAILKTQFNNLFENKMIPENTENSYNNFLTSGKPLVYTDYQDVINDENLYSINVHVPIININSDEIKKINTEIKSEFYDKTNYIMRRREGNTVYNVSWVAYLNGDILSVVIKSSLKEDEKAEKVSVKAYNYNIKDNKEVSIYDLIDEKKLTPDKVQSIIDRDIKTAYTNAKIIAVEYGTLYERDLKSDIYKVKNTENFFLSSDGKVYIVYAYGNNDYTNEMDIIIF